MLYGHLTKNPNILSLRIDANKWLFQKLPLILIRYGCHFDSNTIALAVLTCDNRL